MIGRPVSSGRLISGSRNVWLYLNELHDHTIMSSNRNGPNTHLNSQLFPNYGQSSNTNDNDNSNNNNINNARSRSGGTGSSSSPNVAGNVRSGAGQGSVNPRISVTQSVSSGNELLSGPSPSRASASAGTSGSSSAGIRTGQGDINASRFKAPAHKHAHHLHSIPPKEKSTRTLIIDHLLWVHGVFAYWFVMISMLTVGCFDSLPFLGLV